MVVYTDHNLMTFLNYLQCPNQRFNCSCNLIAWTFVLDVRDMNGSDNVVAGVRPHG